MMCCPSLTQLVRSAEGMHAALCLVAYYLSITTYCFRTKTFEMLDLAWLALSTSDLIGCSFCSNSIVDI